MPFYRSRGRGGGRGGFSDFDRQQVNRSPDGWAVGGSPSRPPPKAGDLSSFGKIMKPETMSFARNSVFSSRRSKDEDVMPFVRNSVFSSRRDKDEDAARGDESSWRTESQPYQRKRLVLQPRTVTDNDAPPASPASDEERSDEEVEVPAPPSNDSKKNPEEGRQDIYDQRLAALEQANIRLLSVIKQQDAKIESLSALLRATVKDSREQFSRVDADVAQNTNMSDEQSRRLEVLEKRLAKMEKLAGDTSRKVRDIEKRVGGGLN